jgi:hypothetical protein
MILLGKQITMKPIPNNLSPEEIVNWIFRSGFGWIELDVNFDLSTWKTESQQCLDHLVVHREGDNHNGWRSCCIHGIDIDKTGIWSKYASAEPEYQWTELSTRTPAIKKFWQSLPFEKYARVRFMEVRARGFVAPHSDFTVTEDMDVFNNIVPINIAITHPEKCNMILEGVGTVPWQEGKVFLVNISHVHSVVNNSDQPRLHMIGHGIPGNKKEQFIELIIRSYQKQYERYTL